MTTEIATNKTFQEKMYERIRDSIGDLLTEEELKKIVETAMDKAFFEKVRHHDGYRTSETDPILVVQMRSLMAAKVEAQCKIWLDNNKDIVEKAIKEQLDKGFLELVKGALEGMMSGAFYNFSNELKNRFNLQG